MRIQLLIGVICFVVGSGVGWGTRNYWLEREHKSLQDAVLERQIEATKKYYNVKVAPEENKGW